MVDVAKRAGRMGWIERLGFVWLALLAAACGGRTSRSTASSNGAGGATNQTDASTTGARWARMAVSPKMSFFDAVAADRSGNAYAAGYFSGPSTLDLGDGVTIAGAYAGDNAFLVKAVCIPRRETWTSAMVSRSPSPTRSTMPCW